MHLLAQPALGADAEAVAHDQHPDQQRRINGGAARVAVVRGEVPVQLAKVQELIDPAEQMVRWNVVFQVEGVEQRHLADFLTSHHRVNFRSIDGTPVNQHQPADSTEFFNGIGQKRTSPNTGIKPTREAGSA